jgi:hypothetical protein
VVLGVLWGDGWGWGFGLGFGVGWGFEAEVEHLVSSQHGGWGHVIILLLEMIGILCLFQIEKLILLLILHLPKLCTLTFLMVKILLFGLNLMYFFTDQPILKLIKTSMHFTITLQTFLPTKPHLFIANKTRRRSLITPQLKILLLTQLIPITIQHKIKHLQILIQLTRSHNTKPVLFLIFHFTLPSLLQTLLQLLFRRLLV